MKGADKHSSVSCTVLYVLIVGLFVFRPLTEKERKNIFDLIDPVWFHLVAHSLVVGDYYTQVQYRICPCF